MQLKKRSGQGNNTTAQAPYHPASGANNTNGKANEQRPSRPVISSTPALIEAAEAGNLARLKQLITNGEDVNASLRSPDGGNRSGETALMRAAQRGRVACVQALIQAGADVHATGPNETTALHEAAAGGHASCMETLLNSGSDASKENNDEKTALDVANDWIAALPDPGRMQRALRDKVEALLALLKAAERSPNGSNSKEKQPRKSSRKSVVPSAPVLKTNGQSATALTIDLPQLINDAEALDAIAKASYGEPLETLEVFHLLKNAETLQLPVSREAPQRPEGKKKNMNCYKRA